MFQFTRILYSENFYTDKENEYNTLKAMKALRLEEGQATRTSGI